MVMRVFLRTLQGLLCMSNWSSDSVRHCVGVLGLTLKNLSLQTVFPLHDDIKSFGFFMQLFFTFLLKGGQKALWCMDYEFWHHQSEIMNKSCLQNQKILLIISYMYRGLYKKHSKQYIIQTVYIWLKSKESYPFSSGLPLHGHAR